MLDLNFVRDNLDRVRAALEARNFPTESLNYFKTIDENRRRVIGESDACNAERNKLSQEIGTLMKGGRRDEAESIRQTVGTLKEEIAQLNDEREQAEKEM